MKRIKVGDLVVSDVCPELIDLEKKLAQKVLLGTGSSSAWDQIRRC